jgi:hypothetical protein
VARKVVGVPIGASFVTTMPTEFGPNGCTLGLGFLSDNTGITLQIVGAVSNTIYIDELLPAVEGISCNINDTSDTAVTVTLTGTNVAGQLSLVTGPAASQPVPYAAPIIAGDTATPANTAQTGGTAASYSRSDHAHGFANPNLLYNSTGEKGPYNIAGLADGWSVPPSSYIYAVASTAWVALNGIPSLFYDPGTSGGLVTWISNPIDVQAGQQLTFSGAGGVTGGASASLLLQYFDGTSWQTFAVSGEGTTPSFFLQVTGICPTGTTQVRCVVNGNESASNSSIALYGLKLESGSVATPWVPSAVAQPWTPYTPVIGGTGWVLGNGTLTGYYHMIDAKTMAVSIELSTGTTTTVGSGALTLSLPATSAAGNTQEIPAKVNFQGSGSGLVVGICEIGPSTSFLTPLAPVTLNSTITTLSSADTIPANTQIMASGIIQIA